MTSRRRDNDDLPPVDEDDVRPYVPEPIKSTNLQLDGDAEEPIRVEKKTMQRRKSAHSNPSGMTRHMEIRKRTVGDPLPLSNDDCGSILALEGQTSIEFKAEPTHDPWGLAGEVPDVVTKCDPLEEPVAPPDSRPTSAAATAASPREIVRARRKNTRSTGDDLGAALASMRSSSGLEH